MARHFYSQTAFVFYGLLAGILVGLFFGESCGVIEPFAGAFVDLLQMTVLPYLVLTLVVNVGKQPANKAWLLAKYGLTVLAALTLLTLFSLLVIPLMLPTWETGSFFSSQTLEPSPSLNLLKQYIPSNIFRSLSENVVPGVVIFCLAVGVAMIGMSEKQRVLTPLDFWCQLLLRISRFIVRLTPFGIFLIAASTCGTMTLEQIGRLQAYVLMQILASSLLTFVLLPGLITSCTPLTYRQIMAVSWDALITGFATGKVLVTIPIIIEAVQKLLKTSPFDSAESPASRTATAESLVPLAYVFPHAGRLLALLFIPFAAWFVGEPIDFDSSLSLMFVGYLTLFGSPVVAIPYLLSFARLPEDLFQLFLLSGIYCGRLGDATGVMYMLAFSLITTALMHGFFKIQYRRLVATLGVTFVILVISLPASQSFLAKTLPSYESREQVIASRHSLTYPSPERVYRELPDDFQLRDPGRSRKEQILESGELRVGYRMDHLPWTFFNNEGALVGYDIDMAHVFAEDLDVELVFVPFTNETLADQINRGEFDIAMSGLAITPSRLLRKNFTNPVIDVNWAFIVRDHQKQNFRTKEALLRLDRQVKIGVPDDSYFVNFIQRNLPDAEVVPLPKARDFFEKGELDALLIDAESGSAWTLLYPKYSVVIPENTRIQQPLGYAVPRQQVEFTDMVNALLRISKDRGIQQQLYDHWIMGQDPPGQTRRWNILQDVLKYKP
jgi:Na+/H+-dicarboxylate symporter